MLAAYLDSVGFHVLLLHGNLEPLDDTLDVIAAVAVAFMLLCFVGYLGLGRKTEQIAMPDTEDES